MSKRNFIKTFEQYSVDHNKMVKENMEQTSPINISSLPAEVEASINALYEAQNDLSYDEWFKKVTNTPYDLENMVNNYLGTALWTSEEQIKEDDPEADINIYNFDKASREKATATVKKFMVYGRIVLGTSGNFDEEQMAHDLWLTSNGHGAGIKDGHYNDNEEIILLYALKDIQSFDVLLSDDGTLNLFG